LSEKRYHHGELRTALISAALDVLERDGPSALSLRALARSVGVSPMAPYHHFPDRASLLAAVATAGFEQLQRRKLATEAVNASPREALIAGAADYVRFILENPNLYRLMKGPEFFERERYPDLHKAAEAPAKTLVMLIASLLDAQEIRSPAPQQAAYMLWSLAHGVGTLALDGQIPSGSAPRLAEDGAAAMIDGWLGAGLAAA
jgi:AcrR family transcriptional regulator